jgi:hypothetical protein
MTNLEIRRKIDSNNALMEKVLSPNTFTLNNVISEMLEENRKLQSLCQHEYEDGYCIWCDLEAK